MAKRKKAQPWDAVFGRVQVIWNTDQAYPPKPSPADLDAAEEKLGFNFPLSYRAFAERFGLGGSLQVAPASGIHITLLSLMRLPGHKPGQWLSVIDRTTGVRERYGRPDHLPLLDRQSRPVPSPRAGGQHDLPPSARPTTDFASAVAFAGDDDEGLGTFLFQPPEVTDAKNREYRIFALNYARALRPVAYSFWEWLEWVEQSYRFPPPAVEDADEPVGPTTIAKPDPPGADILYTRDSERHKTDPTKKELKLWLAWNNHTARDLALSIRDHGQKGAFPILADALQEAGCTNADLLDSCRTGDPDIDGVWVLRVLLGER